MLFIRSGIIVADLAITVSLNSSFAAQTERALKQHFDQVLTKLVVSINFSDLLLASEDRSLSLMLNETMKKGRNAKNIERCDGHGKRLLKNI